MSLPLKNTFEVIQRKTSGMDDASEKIAFRFTAPRTTTITAMDIFIAGVFGTSPTYRFGIQSDDGNGNPDGTFIQFADFSGWLANTFHSLTGFSTSVTAGQVYHFVLQYQSGTIDSSNFIQVGWSSPSNHITPLRQANDDQFDVIFSIDDAATWDFFNGSPTLVLTLNDGTFYGNPWEFVDGTGAGTLTSTDWIRQRLEVEEDTTVSEIRVKAARSSADPVNHQLITEIWDSADNVLVSQPVSNGQGLNNFATGFTNNTKWIGANIPTTVLKVANSPYYLVLKTNKTAGAGESDYVVSVLDMDEVSGSPLIDATYGGDTDSFLQSSTDSGGDWTNELDKDLNFELVSPASLIASKVTDRFRKEKRYYFITETIDGIKQDVTAKWDFDAITRELNGSMDATITTDKDSTTFRDGSTELSNNVLIRVSTDKTGPEGVDYFAGFIAQRMFQASGQGERVVFRAFGHLSKLYQAIWRISTTVVHDFTSTGKKASELAKQIIDNYRSLDGNAKIDYTEAGAGGGAAGEPAATLYDDHDDNSVDTAKWTIEVQGNGTVPTVTEVNSADLRLHAPGDGSNDNDRAHIYQDTAGENGAKVVDFEFTQGASFNSGWIGISTDNLFTNAGSPIPAFATSGDYIAIRIGAHANPSPDEANLETNGYTVTENNGPIALSESTNYTLKIYENGDGTIKVYIDTTLLATITGSIAAGSKIRYVAGSSSDATRHFTLLVSESHDYADNPEVVETGGDTQDSVEDSTTTVKDKFELITFGEALERVISLAHTDGRLWFFRVLGDNVFTFKRASTDADHSFIFGRDITSMRIDQDLVNGDNEVFLYFNNASIRRYQNSTNITKNGYISHTQRESNVPDTITADEIGNAVLEAKTPPINKIILVVSDRYDRGIEFINPGDTCEILNVPDSISELLTNSMLITKTIYRKDEVELELSIRQPLLESSVENLRREFEQSRTEGVPSSFTDV